LAFFVQGHIVTYEPSANLDQANTCIGALIDDMPDLVPQQDTPTEEDVYYWTHEDDEEDEATVRAMIEAADDPQEAFKQRLHCGGAYVEEILDD